MTVNWNNDDKMLVLHSLISLHGRNCVSIENLNKEITKSEQEIEIDATFMTYLNHEIEKYTSENQVIELIFQRVYEAVETVRKNKIDKDNNIGF